MGRRNEADIQGRGAVLSEVDLSLSLLPSWGHSSSFLRLMCNDIFVPGHCISLLGVSERIPQARCLKPWEITLSQVRGTGPRSRCQRVDSPEASLRTCRGLHLHCCQGHPLCVLLTRTRVRWDGGPPKQSHFTSVTP